MSFHEVRFPDAISYGSSGGPGFNTSIVTTDSGQEYRIPRWSNARRRYNAAWGVKSHEDLADIITFYLARMGPAYGFRFKDFLDCTSADPGYATELGGADAAYTDQVIGTGDASTVNFQLVKKYTSGVITRTRTITKPVVDTTVIALDGVEATTGWTVNTTNGIVTFTAAPSLGQVITAGFEFDVPVRFGNETDESFQAVIEDYGSGNVGDIPLIEIMDNIESDGEFYYGGSDFIEISANTSITPLMGRVLSIRPTSASLKVILPDPTNLPAGGPYFYIYNDEGTTPYVLSICDEDETEINTLSASDTCTIVLTESKVWVMI